MTRNTRYKNCLIAGQRHPFKTETDRGPQHNRTRDCPAARNDMGIGRLTRRSWIHNVLVSCLALSFVTLPFTPLEARYASIVIDAQSGAVLHETNADTRNYPASLVKMMTLYLTFEALTRHQIQLDQPLKVSKRAQGMAPSRLGLGAGQTIRAEDAMLAVITKSANDAAVVLAETLGGSEIKFARTMNNKARELGMTRTRFCNATGLPNRRQLSTARDMATLARAVLKDFPQYYGLFSVTEFHYRDRTYHNHNRLLDSYDGADGIKTGYTRASGFNLAASVERGDHRLIAVVFGGKTAKSRDRHTVKLLDRAFARAATVADLASLATPSMNGTDYSHQQLRRAQPESGMGKAEAPMARYGAQVGAYYRYNQAKHAATAAARRLPESVAEPLLWIPKIKGRRGALFLARLVGLTKNGARQACQHLRAADIDCLAIRVNPPTSVALN